MSEQRKCEWVKDVKNSEKHKQAQENNFINHPKEKK